MLGMNSCGGSDPGLSAAFDLRYVTVANRQVGSGGDGRLYRSHQRDVFSCSSKFLADYNYNGVLTRYKARRRLSHSSRHSFSSSPRFAHHRPLILSGRFSVRGPPPSRRSQYADHAPIAHLFLCDMQSRHLTLAALDGLSHADLPVRHNACDESSLRIRGETDGAGAGAKRQGGGGTLGSVLA